MFDYSILVAVLSILVTVLIGFQIFNLIDFNQRLQRVKKKIRKQYRVDVEKAKYDATGMALAQLGLSQYYNGDYSNAIRSLFNAIGVLADGSKDDFATDAYSHAVDLIYSIVTDERVSGSSFSSDEKRTNIVIASSIKDKDKRDKILDFLYASKIQVPERKNE